MSKKLVPLYWEGKVQVYYNFDTNAFYRDIEPMKWWSLIVLAFALGLIMPVIMRGIPAEPRAFFLIIPIAIGTICGVIALIAQRIFKAKKLTIAEIKPSPLRVIELPDKTRKQLYFNVGYLVIVLGVSIVIAVAAFTSQLTELLPLSVFMWICVVFVMFHHKLHMVICFLKKFPLEIEPNL